MFTEIAGLKISYKSSQELNQKVAAGREETEKDLALVKITFKTLKKRLALLKKFLGVTV